MTHQPISLRAALSAGAALGLLAVAAPAWAQDDEDKTDEASIIVTGEREPALTAGGRYREPAGPDRAGNPSEHQRADRRRHSCPRRVLGAGGRKPRARRYQFEQPRQRGQLLLDAGAQRRDLGAAAL